MALKPLKRPPPVLYAQSPSHVSASRAWRNAGSRPAPKSGGNIRKELGVAKASRARLPESETLKWLLSESSSRRASRADRSRSTTDLYPGPGIRNQASALPGDSIAGVPPLFKTTLPCMRDLLTQRRRKLWVFVFTIA